MELDTGEIAGVTENAGRAFVHGLIVLDVGENSGRKFGMNQRQTVNFLDFYFRACGSEPHLASRLPFL